MSATTITERIHTAHGHTTAANLDPAPWVHADGRRVTDPHAPGAPIGGYTYSPREGYDDYPDRYISTRHASRSLEESSDAE